MKLLQAKGIYKRFYSTCALSNVDFDLEEGEVLARHEAVCPPEGGDAGVLTAMLPEDPCVLQLSLRLMCGEDTLEESVLPVYVGARGMLEAAF